MGLVPRLYLGDGKIRGKNINRKRTYINIVNTSDIDERIVAPEVKLEELDNIASSRRLKNSSLCDKDIQTCAVNAIAIDNIQNSHSLRELLHVDYLSKEEEIHVDVDVDIDRMESLINIAICFVYRTSR